MVDDPKSQLQDAIAILTEFNTENETTHKTISLMRRYFKLKKAQPQKNFREVKRAIDLLKSHYRLIERFSEGTAQEKKLASAAVAAIEQYNSIIEKVRQKPSGLNARINHFLRLQSGLLLPLELSKIHFPKAQSLQIHYTEGKTRVSCSMINPHAAAASRKISHFSSSIVPVSPVAITGLSALPRQTLELFQMKAISLIEQHGLLSNSEARSAMRKAHFQSQIGEDLSKCSVCCTVSPFPGHTILISGMFEKSRDTFVIPKNESFQLTLTTAHTGFPYPVQYTGWALPDLVPPYPHCLEDLPLFKLIYQHKLAVAQGLQPNQELVAQSKEILVQKREQVQNNISEYLTLQQELCLALAAAATQEGISEEVHTSIVRFFAKLKQLNPCFDYYAETHQMINENFIGRPIAKLEAAWLEKSKPHPPLAILGIEAEKAKQEFIQQKIVAETELEKCTLDFILTMGSILATPCHRILLQHFSEMRFTPPMLDDFEQKLQMALYRQLTAFLAGKPIDLLKQIQADIDLFKAPSFESLEGSDPAAELVNELEGYFNSRYYSMLN